MPSRVALLDDSRTAGGQAAEAWGLGVDVAERLDLIAFVVQQLEVARPTCVHLFHPLEVSFKEMRPLRSTGRGPAGPLSCAAWRSFRFMAAGQAVLSQQGRRLR